jgi:uncharacterized membrane protein YeaQ/YmgE (transglycosylase-associated protein family)
MVAVQQVWAYFQAYPLSSAIIAYVAGWAASVTVERGRSRIWAFHIIVGVFGSFLGHYAVVYFGLREILEKLPSSAISLIFSPPTWVPLSSPLWFTLSSRCKRSDKNRQGLWKSGALC